MTGPSSKNGFTRHRFVRSASAFCLMSSQKWYVLFSMFGLSPLHHVLNWQVFYIDIYLITYHWKVNTQCRSQFSGNYRATYHDHLSNHVLSDPRFSWIAACYAANGFAEIFYCATKLSSVHYTGYRTSVYFDLTMDESAFVLINIHPSVSVHYIWMTRPSCKSTVSSVYTWARSCPTRICWETNSCYWLQHYGVTMQ